MHVPLPLRLVAPPSPVLGDAELHRKDNPRAAKSSRPLKVAGGHVRRQLPDRSTGGTALTLRTHWTPSRLMSTRRSLGACRSCWPITRPRHRASIGRWAPELATQAKVGSTMSVKRLARAWAHEVVGMRGTYPLLETGRNRRLHVAPVW